MNPCAHFARGFSEVRKNRSFALFLLFGSASNLIAETHPAAFASSGCATLVDVLAVVRRVANTDEDIPLIFQLSSRLMLLCQCFICKGKPARRSSVRAFKCIS